MQGLRGGIAFGVGVEGGAAGGAAHRGPLVLLVAVEACLLRMGLDRRGADHPGALGKSCSCRCRYDLPLGDRSTSFPRPPLLGFLATTAPAVDPATAKTATRTRSSRPNHAGAFTSTPDGFVACLIDRDDHRRDSDLTLGGHRQAAGGRADLDVGDTGSPRHLGSDRRLAVPATHPGHLILGRAHGLGSHLAVDIPYTPIGYRCQWMPNLAS